jgi:predicted ABC-type transport system involved in lysophospholipase L1 biosynthesis ATPase subunit
MSAAITDTTAPAVVQASHVSRSFQRGSESIHVLEDLSLEVKTGEFLALMGPSGSGKSTLLNLIGGLDRPTGGSITVAGERIDTLPESRLTSWRARHVGLVFQFYNLLPVLSAERNVELPLLLTQLNSAQRRKHVETALKIVGLGHRLNTPRARSPAASSNGWASRGRLSPTPPCSSATNRPAISTASPATKCLPCCTRSIASTARRSSWSRTIPTPRRGRAGWFT